MKYLRRFLSLLFALATCVNLFSVTALADSSEYYISSEIVKYSGTTEDWIWFYEYPLVDTAQDYWRDDSVRYDSSVYYRSDLFVEKYDESLIAEAHDDVTFHLNNVYREIRLVNGNDVTSVPWRALDSLQLIAVHTDGTYTYFDTDTIQFNYDPNSLYGNFSAQFKVDKDTRKLIVRTTYNPTNRTGLTGNWEYSLLILSDYTDQLDATVDIELQTKEAGLLSGILDVIKEFWNTVKNGFDNIIKTITELPQKLWELIENGLKSLFVPSEETIITFKENIDLLLADRLGAVYQSVTYLHSLFENIFQNSNGTASVINLPEVTIDLPIVGGSVPFTFGGYDVQIVPNGFEFFVEIIQVVVGFCVTILFINGLRKRYEEVMGVEK